MCGFTGFVGAIENKEQVLENMMNTIVHRGPDSAGTFLDDDAALGFRRLSIIDISSTGDQPLYNEDRTKVLVFNGEIYNYQELREKLIEAGHELRHIPIQRHFFMDMRSGEKRWLTVFVECMGL